MVVSVVNPRNDDSASKVHLPSFRASQCEHPLGGAYGQDAFALNSERLDMKLLRVTGKYPSVEQHIVRRFVGSLSYINKKECNDYSASDRLGPSATGSVLGVPRRNLYGNPGIADSKLRDRRRVARRIQ